MQIINTICRDCVFAIYDDMREQAGCELQRIDKFEKQGTEVIGQDDGTNKYLMIKGRFCNTCRNGDWGKRYDKQDWKRKVMEECSIQCNFLIYVDETSTVDDVKTSLNTVINQAKPPPKSVTLIVSRPDNDAGEYALMFRTMEVPFKWRVQKVINSEKCTFDYLSSIDFALDNILEGNYYTAAHAGYEWPLDYLKVINDAINEDLVQVLGVHPLNEKGDGLFLEMGTHKSLNGNGYLTISEGEEPISPILNKIQKIYTLNNVPNMVYRWGSLKIYESHRDHIVL